LHLPCVEKPGLSREAQQVRVRIQKLARSAGSEAVVEGVHEIERWVPCDQLKCMGHGVSVLETGSLLFIFMRTRGRPNPSLREWGNLAVIGTCMFVLTYGPLFWAEQYVSSSITSIIEATLPITTLVLEVFVFRTQRLGWGQLGGVALGFSGVALLLVGNGEQHLAVIPCVVILAAGVSWSLGAVLSRRLHLPSSPSLSVGAQMMVGGAVLLGVSAAMGEMHPLPTIPLGAGLALLYLIIGGSLVAYTAYTWLLRRFSATRVASHAYVNPVVAMALGYFAAGETITPRSIVASALVVFSVCLILTGAGGHESP
jgi:drug/metabolite transporter (DMT)-like permease